MASRALMQCLARHGFTAMVLSGTVLESGQDLDPAEWLAGQGFVFEEVGERTRPAHEADLTAEARCLRLRERDVSVVIQCNSSTRHHFPDDSECRRFIGLFDRIASQFRPDIIVNYGGDALATEVRRRGRARGAMAVFAVHNFAYHSLAPFVDTDAVIVPSRFAASYYRKSLKLDCKSLSNLIDIERVRATARDARYVTFVNPSYEKGVFVFARIADELGRRRPDIPLLVVEGRGTERTLVDCGLDLRGHGNVSLMTHTPDPRQFWGATRICVMPSLWWENQPLVAVEAMVNGIPVIGSDRGGIPEALGDAGIVLGIPSRLTPFTRELPTAEEIRHWVKAIIALWDDPAWYDEMSRRALAESRRWAPEVLEPQYVEFFENLRRRDVVTEPSNPG